MNNMERLASSIRNCVNNSNLYDKCYKDNLDKWTVLCVSMDTLEDTCTALLHFESEGIGDDTGEKYLNLYGVLQAIFLQQYAIKYLYESLVQPFTELRTNLANWETLRELRNLSVGHPIEMKRQKIIKRCFISRVSISSHGFQLVIYNATENKHEFEDIDLQKLYSGYKGEATAILSETLANLAKGQK